jgi:hypothetical protein
MVARSSSSCTARRNISCASIPPAASPRRAHHAQLPVTRRIEVERQLLRHRIDQRAASGES